MADDTADKLAVFDFMVVRSPEVVDTAKLHRNYINDTVLPARGTGPMTHVPPVELKALQTTSVVGRLVYDKVFCSAPKPEAEALQDLFAALLGFLVPRVPVCQTAGENGSDGGEGEPVEGEESGGGTAVGTRRPVLTVGSTTTLPLLLGGDHNGTAAAVIPEPLVIEDIDRHAHIEHGGFHYILPDRLDQLRGLPLIESVILADAFLQQERQNFDLARLLSRLKVAFHGRTAVAVVFADGQHAADYAQAKRGLFDVLYLLYMLRRWVTVELDDIIRGLRVLHVLEALALDELYRRARAGTLDDSGGEVLGKFVGTFPALQGWDLKSQVPGFPLVANKKDLEAYLSAAPVIHSIFARLFRFLKPFNPIQPIGIGDLKVVKQWLRGYHVGEIAHVENVLQSEKRGRVRRELDKTEDVFSFATDTQEETQRDTQSTDRFEIKREAESIVKAELAANAGLGVTLDTTGAGYKIISTLTAGFAYNRSQTDTTKAALNYAHDVVDKAVRRVQTRASQQRTTTKLFEAEETNRHEFDNKAAGKGHITGLYHWLDKEYRSRVYNYGKRMMFEFVVPEPAAFFVEARLRAFEADLELPRRPKEPTFAKLPDEVVTLDPKTIGPEKFDELAKTYDLGDLRYPQVQRFVDFVDSATGRNYFTEHGMDESTWQGRSYSCRLNAKDYRIKTLTIQGFVYFYGRKGLPTDEDPPAPKDVNTFEVFVDGQRLRQEVNNAAERWYYAPGWPSEFPIADALPFKDDQVSLFLGFWDIEQFDLSFHAELELDPSVLADFRNRVYQRILTIEQKRIDARNAELEQAYQSDLSTYRNRVSELRGTVVNELLQGQSEAYNRRLITRELKRQCLSMLTKEFDADDADDVLTKIDAMGEHTMEIDYHRFDVEERDTNGKPELVAEFELTQKKVKMPAPDLAKAREKGRYVQFLEQAFEWEQLAYVSYPYFWASPPQWVELMSHSDRADPFMTDFLQAGSARVMVAVTPHYDDAVLHYLDTGLPWAGGDAPIIGNPLYIPLYEELRRQQDDLANATPEGDTWTFTLPTSLVYLENSSTPLPPVSDQT